MSDELNFDFNEPFFAVFTIDKDSETVSSSNFQEAFETYESAEEFADKATNEDAESRIIVHCTALTIVEATTTKRSLGQVAGLPQGVKAPPKPKSVLK